MNYVIQWEWLDFRTEWGYLQMNSLWWIEIEKTNKNLIFRYKHLVEADLNIPGLGRGSKIKQMRAENVIFMLKKAKNLLKIYRLPPC